MWEAIYKFLKDITNCNIICISGETEKLIPMYGSKVVTCTIPGNNRIAHGITFLITTLQYSRTYCNILLSDHRSKEFTRVYLSYS